MDTHSEVKTDGIAIVGMSGRFPGARNVDEFWKNLISGIDTISRFSPEDVEFSAASDAAESSGRKVVRARATLSDVDLFDASFFGIYPREAELMDPQHRLFLECAWESLESAGYDPESFPGLIGVYAGLSLNTYLIYNLCKDRAFAADFAGQYQVGNYSVMLGNDKDFMPTRVSYKLNLKGPSIAIQTACSTSLVAISEACTSLLTYQTDMAIAGGVSISFPQRRDYLHQEEGMVSADGTCRSFDAKANGTVFGHGVAVLLLKRLEDAIAAGDHVLAVVKGSAINNDGSSKIGYAAPSVRAQADVILMAQAAANVDPDTISYIEAHGTGTPLGDPIEVAALNLAFADAGSKKKGFCALGTGKTYIGHLDVAAGATGVIKTILQLQNEKIPPLLHFTEPNPKVDFAAGPLYPATKVIDWKRNNAPRRAGVSAFGVGGTNAHVILEEAPLFPPSSSSRHQQLIVLSAKTDTALVAMAANLAAHLESHPDISLADAAYTLQLGRKAFPHRRAIVATDVASAALALRKHDGVSNNIGSANSSEVSVIFLFPGQGAQYVNMGRELYESEPVFRDAVDQCTSILKPLLDSDLTATLYPPVDTVAEAEQSINETWIAQPAIFVVEYALAQLWLSWGLKPSTVVGHSVGEYVCAVLAETFTLEDALTLLAKRAKLIQALPPGSMLAVRLGEAELKPLIPEGASLAVINSQSLCVVSGPTELLKSFQSELETRKAAAIFLPTSHAFHSAMMEPMLPEFTEAVTTTKRSAPKLRWVSTCTGLEITEETMKDPAYWSRQIREPVRFPNALATAVGDSDPILLEVGPGQALTQMATQFRAVKPGKKPASTLGAAKGGNNELSSVLKTLGRLWSEGVAIDWTAFYRDEQRYRVPLPTYPFERKRFWVDPAPIPSAAIDSAVRTNAATVEPQPQAFSKAPEFVATEVAAQVSAPVALVRTSRKDRLATAIQDIIRDLSGVDVPNYDTAFLDLGFDSLFLTQASQAIQSKFNVRVTFRQMFADLSSVSALAGYLDKNLPPEAFPDELPPAVLSSAATAPALAVSGAGPSDDATLNQLLATQTQLIQKILEMKQGRAPRDSGAPTSSLPPVRWPAGKSKDTQAEGEVKRFGPYKPVETGRKGALTDRQQAALDTLISEYTAKTIGSKEYTAEHRSHFADPRAVSGFTLSWKELIYPIVSARSKGSRIWDVDGNEYIDITMGFGTYFFGHSPDWLIPAIEEQLHTGIEIGPQNPLAGKAAKLISEFTGLDRVTFCNTGSEAVMAAIRLARTVTGRKRVVYFTGDYHGMFEEVLVRGAWINGEYRAQAIAPGIPASLVENMLVLDYADPNSLEIIRTHADDLAAILVEPVQSRRPGLQPREFMHELRAITEKCGAALIFDEVVTGFRCHIGGAQAYFGVKADMATYGKVIGGGIPVGVLAGSRRFMDALDGGAWQYGDESVPEVGMTFFAGTFVRHPLAMAAVWRVLNYLKDEGPDLQKRMTDRVTRFCSALNEYFEAVQAPVRLSHFSAFAIVEYPHDLKYASLLWFYLRKRGIHIWEGRPCYFTVAHTDADYEAIIQAFKDSVAEMQLAGFLPGPEDGQPTKPLDSFPLTEAQRELWFASQISEEASRAFNETCSIHFDGTFNEKAMRDAIAEVVRRHEALRITFSPHGEDQQVNPTMQIEMPLLDLSQLSPELQEAEVGSIQGRQGGHVFDLENGPLIALQLLKLSDTHHILVFTVHHIACDGWSYDIILRELGHLYTCYQQGTAPNLPQPMPFREYSAWEERQKDEDSGKVAEAFWLKEFAKLPSTLELPTDRPRPSIRTFAGDRLTHHLPAALFQAVKQTASRQHTTLFTTMLTAFEILLCRLSGQEDIVVGIPAAGQNVVGSESLVGHCANLLPLRSDIRADLPVSESLKAVQNRLLDAYDHQAFTVGALLQSLKIPRDVSRVPLAPVFFNIDPPLSDIRFDGLKHWIALNPRHAYQFELGFNLVEEDGGVTIECDYNTDLFDPETIRRWMAHYQRLLEDIVTDVMQCSGRLALMDSQAQLQLIHEWNRTDRDYPRDRTVPDLVRDQAARTPDAIAVECDGKKLTYAELEKASGELARVLAGSGIKPDVLVGLCVERSLDMVVGLLAVQKAGGAYVPIDPEYPADRISLILEDAAPPVLLTQTPLLSRLPKTDARIVCIDDLGDSVATIGAEPPGSGPNDVAYVIYTSGSTGKPKGVEIQQQALVNFLVSMQATPGLESKDVVLALTTLCFDISGLELMLPLITGGTVAIVRRQVAIDPNQLVEAMDRTGATVVQATPATFRMLLEAGWRGDSTLKILCGGEAITPDLAEQLGSRCRELWNVYGPTETTIWSTLTKLIPGEKITVGKPIANTQTYIVDTHGDPVPVGVAGELLIGGDGLARGYRNRPELTTEKFITDKFRPRPGGRLYKTGDLARYLSNGDIEVLGRLDFQVKIRGHRIELGEIESAILSHGKIKETVVVAHGDTPDNKRLVAYYSLKAGSEAVVESKNGSSNGVHAEDRAKATSDIAAELKDIIRGRLPEYMMPACFMQLEALPHTPNEKIDRRALPAPVFDTDEAEREIIEPRTDKEKKLAQIWSEVLGVRRIGIRNNFFDLGGHSLLAVTVFTKIEETFHVRLPLATLFSAPTVELLAAAIHSPDEAKHRWSCLVPIQPKGTKTPFFCIHGAGGNVLLYRELVRHLGEDHPFYGLQSQGLDGKSTFLTTIEEMAAHYLKEIREAQPHGPYLLGGYCMGGTVAYEIAQQLLRAGEEVGLVALFDTYNFSLALQTTSGKMFRQKLQFHLKNITGLKVGELVKYVAEKVRVARDGELESVLRTGRESKTATAESESGKAVVDSLQAVNDFAGSAYQPEPLKARLTVFKTKVNYDCYPDPNMGWLEMAKGGLDLVELPVNPHAMLVEPYVKQLADPLRQRMDAVDRK